ncbi:MAG: ATP-binding protein [Caulobacteraceae bacterium]
MFRSSSLRLATFYTVAFALAVVVLGVVTVLTTRNALGRQFDGRIRAESASLAQEYRTEGLLGVVQAVRERDRTPGALDFGLRDAAGTAIAGRLAATPAPLGWSILKSRGTDEDVDRTRIYATRLPGGYRLLVGDDTERAEILDGALIKSFTFAFFGVIVLGVVGGYGLSRGVHRRLASITGAAEAIIDGDLSRRVPVHGADDDLDRLAATLNRMLDRIAGLMENLRHVSNDIAHDLRTPLTRLRGRLEAALVRPGLAEHRDLLEGAIVELDALLGAFAALLRIAQIEAGARRAAFHRIGLAEVAATVVEAFAPSAEDAGATLRLEARANPHIEGDPELLTQMLVNLVENALRHAGPHPDIRVVCRTVADAPVLSVIDDGPGVPVAERERLFDRFHRLESSRSTAGSGLGLALVSAVAKLHGAEASLHDARPGLEARIAFSRAAT